MVLSQIIRVNRLTALPVRTMCTAGSDIVLAQEIGDKGVITLNRQKALNAVNLDMVRKIYAPLKHWENTKKLVIIKGAGEKSFCAGGDVRTLVETGPTEESKNFFREEYTLNHLIGNYKIPYVALIDGITMGGGVGLSVHGKFRVATERTMFAMPETAIGLFPDVGGGHFLPRLGGKLGMYLGLTGFRLKGQDVFKSGIATHFVSSTRLPEMESELLTINNPQQVDTILKKYHSVDSQEFILGPHLEKINELFRAECVEDILQALQKEGSDWSTNTLKGLNKMSPTSLKVTFKQISLGKSMDLAKCLKMEYRMAVRHLEDSDFKEGVRALLIDKDNQPKWTPDSLAGVTDTRVNYYFAEFDNPKDELNL